ncbi:tumor necrosis factor ligand superfamily member 6-like [Scyliorhinus canicula]|uniref:tumor necrosis factor ligand superfamily member 6-like n=1 Tax=Scyliorhinus canicula TaxID=7830 RepID=UPI0018F593FD|nr:tumor necrosis factor ligand superfamily member 6-like [Scyliorhinus canicula]
MAEVLMETLDISNPLTNAMPPNNKIAQPEKKEKLQKLFTAIALLLILVTLMLSTWNAVNISKLQLKQVNSRKQRTEMQNQRQALKNAAHLTGMNVINSSTALIWDSVRGLAFVQGVSHSAEKLIIIEAGFYLIYTKVSFRGHACQSDMLLEHTVLKRSDRYHVAIEIMKTRNRNNCPGNNGQWSRDSFQSGIFQLRKGDRIYVTVSNPAFVNFRQVSTFFGLHKL